MSNREKLRHQWVTRIADYRASGLTMSACSSDLLSTSASVPQTRRRIRISWS
ncbi:hypothetical protein [Paenibacillus elgii]|uniref:hypothetical protein n=1 Tax=Paenibacillus elgii TaxID=189691 RepID=UPI0030D72672